MDFLTNGTALIFNKEVEWDRGAGTRENKGQKGYRRREEKGREAGFPKWQEPGERRKNLQYCRTFYNRNITKRQEPLQKRQEVGVKGTGGGSFRPPCLPPQGNGLD